MSLRRCVLTDVRSMDDVYRQLAEQLPLPAHFGNNLDALWDALSTDLPGPLEIVWHRPHTLGARAEDLLELLREAEQSRDDLSFLIAP
ncbi:MAG: hypothetical protein RL210_2280 [Pseudomonadota bacterium]|jgi:ribonuclease inhibitor|nr:ribonuclease inhibitor [Pseudomonadota bacterium]